MEGNVTLALMLIFTCIGGSFQAGYNLAIINYPVVHIQIFLNDTFQERWSISLEQDNITLLWTIIVSSYSLGGLLGALLAGPMSVGFGRKGALLVKNCFVFSSAIFSGASRAARSVEMIILARILIGVCAGVSMSVEPMYFSESAPKHLRGAVTFSSAIFFAFGIVMGQVVGLTDLLGKEPHWHYLFITIALPALIHVLTLPWFPESPRFLLIDKGDQDACCQALRRLRGGTVPQDEMAEMLQEKEMAVGAEARSLWSLLSDRSLWPQLRIVLVISCAMMFCGNDAIYYYAFYIFHQVNISMEKIQYAAIGTGASELVATFLCIVLIERVGRRKLLMGGYALMAFWGVVFTIALNLQDTVSGIQYLSLVCTFAFILSFGMGPAGVTGVLPGELFDQKARPAAYMLTGALMWFSALLVGMTFPFVVGRIGKYCFLPFCASCVLACIFLGLQLPETKGRTLAEITEMFNRRNGRSPAQNPEMPEV